MLPFNEPVSCCRDDEKDVKDRAQGDSDGGDGSVQRRNFMQMLRMQMLGMGLPDTTSTATQTAPGLRRTAATQTDDAASTGARQQRIRGFRTASRHAGASAGAGFPGTSSAANNNPSPGASQSHEDHPYASVNTPASWNNPEDR